MGVPESRAPFDGEAVVVLGDQWLCGIYDLVYQRSDIEVLGEAFKARDYEFRKSEVVVFLRPTVVRSPSLDGDLRNFTEQLPRNQKLAEPLSVFDMVSPP